MVQRAVTCQLLGIQDCVTVSQRERPQSTEAVVPLHDLVIFLDLLLDMGEFALQILTTLFLLQERRILPEGKVISFNVISITLVIVYYVSVLML